MHNSMERSKVDSKIQLESYEIQIAFTQIDRPWIALESQGQKLNSTSG